MGDKKATKGSPPLSRRRPGIDTTGIPTLVAAAMKSRGEWVSIAKDSPSSLGTSIKVAVGSLFCEVTETGGERMYLRIKRENEL